ncbi:T9SS type B sorting domain-containing protein [Spirosoma endbachense]|uniref:T9SS type B sorting domain-containing protein n=1 Tax=Spirosoma endbachense TaxID=2666025 RepID=A0A6P1VT04_9BACT|nr:gliding motility-associated C-terminal domain-containing protein [Spirosoma endbachense]QHV95754.1 T9SS type B sorting domain-containing protein [Spirosoma endbachense]
MLDVSHLRWQICLIYFIFIQACELKAQCKQTYSWANWQNFTGNQATGNILVDNKVVSVTMSANYGFFSTTGIYRVDVFSKFSGYNAIPNATVPATQWSIGSGGKTTMCFSEPVTNPILLLASLGRTDFGNIIKVTLTFSEPYTVLHDAGGTTFIDSYSLSATEGNAIILFPGTFTCLTIYSETPENYTNLTWGLQPPLFPVNIATSQECDKVTLTASGGSTYKWSGGETPNGASNVVRTSGVYSVTATDQNGCTSIALKTITLSPKTALTSALSKTICQGDSYAGYKSSGTYVDIFKTTGGCDSTRTLNLSVLDIPKITLDKSREICEGQSTELNPALTLTNSPVNYKWTTGETTPKISVKQAGLYSVTIANGICSTIASTSVTVNQQPTIKPDEEICLNSAPIRLSSGAVANRLTYLWQPANSTDSTLVVMQAGQYQVTVTTGAGCKASRTIMVRATPQIELGADQMICDGATVDLVPTISSSGQSSTYRYQWSSGATTKMLTAGKPGLYKLTVSQGVCHATDSVKVDVSPVPRILPDTTTCTDKLLSAGGLESNLTYFWQPSNETTSTIKAQQAGTYKVTITNKYNCSAIRTILVTGSCMATVFAPDVFTPNADQVNDTFKLIVMDGLQIRLTIYDRWGAVIYSGESSNPQWDGKYKDEECLPGVYPFVLLYKSLNNDELHEHRGSLSLIR